MSTNTLFDSEKQRSSKKFALILAVLLVLAGGVGYGVWKFRPQPPKKDTNPYADEKLRDSIVMLLAQPRFSGELFREQMLGSARIQRYIVDKGVVYFSLPDSSEEEFQTGAGKFIVDPLKIERAREIEGELVLDRYSLLKTPETGYFFRTPLENLKFETDGEMTFPFQRAIYTLSVREMIDFYNNSRIYGGKLAADTSIKIGGQTVLFANHGTMVAKPNEPSLNRLVDELLRDVPDKQVREVKIQKLLDFVTNEIEYDFTEALGNYETLKRPNEVLMSRTSDCSNKTILMASLLEQIGEDYLLLYCPQHITVAVPQGAFPNQNNLKFEWEGKNWMIAETTLPNFEIGVTRVQESVLLTSIQYVQKPRQTNVIFDAQTFRPLELR
ncbi:MAG: hypothetical protein R2747_18315 [Pyrinomonadaceae bacterium]